jgi:type IV secretory pathway TrbD component
MAPRTSRARIPGYQEDIHQAVWKRITTVGVPRPWFIAWGGLCLYLVFFVIYLLPLRWLVAVGVVWVVGVSIMAALTLWDPQWDDVALTHLRRRYKRRYEAG